MRTFDTISFLLLVLIGLWMIAAPRSVQRFYRWLHRGEVSDFSSGKLSSVRIAGGLWLAIVLCAALLASKM